MIELISHSTTNPLGSLFVIGAYSAKDDIPLSTCRRKIAGCKASGRPSGCQREYTTLHAIHYPSTIPQLQLLWTQLGTGDLATPTPAATRDKVQSPSCPARRVTSNIRLGLVSLS